MRKKKVYLTLMALLVLCIGGWLFWFLVYTPSDAVETDALLDDASVDPSPADAMQKLITEAKDDPEKSEGLFEALLALLPSKQRHQYRLGFAELDEMSFYGKVVDQYGQPVVDATLEVEGGGRLLTPGAGKARIRTDAEGKFGVHMDGGSLIITNVLHPNIKFLFPNHLEAISDSGQGGVTFWGYQRMVGGNEPLWSDYTEDNPYIFQAWRIEPDELVANLKSDRDNFRVDCEGNTYSIDMLVPPRSKKRLVLGGAEGQLRVRLTCKSDSPKQVADVWSAELEVIDGGLLETNDRYMFKAPESGYSPSYRMGTQVEGSSDSGAGRKKFYFMSNEGREYGSLIISIYPLPSRPIVSIQYNINPNGGRSLLGPDRDY